MNTCPQCHATANPLRLLLLSRSIAYRCGRCGGRSRLPKRQMSAVGVLTVGLCIGFALAGPADLGFWRTFAYLMPLVAVIVGGVLVLFTHLEPIEGRP